MFAIIDVQLVFQGYGGSPLSTSLMDFVPDAASAIAPSCREGMLLFSA